jgi:hypothetical protein
MIEEYCNYDLSLRLKNIGYDNVSDKVYCETVKVRPYIRNRYPGFTHDDLYQFTVDGGGVLPYDEVFTKSINLVDYEYRDTDYVLAPRLVEVMQWIECKYKMKMLLDVEKGYYKVKLLYNDDVWNILNSRPYYIHGALRDFIKQAVEIIEHNLQNKK